MISRTERPLSVTRQPPFIRSMRPWEKISRSGTRAANRFVRSAQSRPLVAENRHIALEVRHRGCHSACNIGSDSDLMNFLLSLRFSNGGNQTMRAGIRISSLVPSGLVIDSISDSSHSIILAVRSEGGTAECPLCGVRSRRIHSRYGRQVADLPCGGKQIRLRVTTRQFVCEVPHCRRRIFAERFGDEVLPTRSRRTARLECIVHHLGLALGGRPAASFAKRLMLPVSNDTLLRVVRRRARPRTEPLIVAGIDDWAFRKNHRYGTIVCDLERRRIVTLLPDREIATVRAWLSNHPEIRVVSRDRGGGYGEAAAKALPDAVQVADRWHLMENASAAFLNAVRRSMRVIRTAIGATMINPKLLTCAERLQYEGYLRRTQTNAVIMALVCETQCHSRRSSVEQGTAVNSFAKSVAARVRMSSGRGKARSMLICPFWIYNGARAAVMAQSFGVVCKGKASRAPCV